MRGSGSLELVHHGPILCGFSHQGFPRFTAALTPIPSTGDILSFLLHLAFGQGVIVFLILSISALQSWYATLKKATVVARSAGAAAGGAISSIRKFDRINRTFTIACSALMLISQGLWLTMNYAIGNLLSALFDVNRGLHNITEGQIPSWSHFLNALRWDAVSEGYVLFSIAGLAASYVYAKRRKSTDGMSMLFGLPGYVYGFCGLVGGTLSLALDAVDHASHHNSYAPAAWIILMYGAGITGTLYAIGCRWLFRAPATVRSLWSERVTA